MVILVAATGLRVAVMMVGAVGAVAAGGCVTVATVVATEVAGLVAVDTGMPPVYLTKT